LVVGTDFYWQNNGEPSKRIEPRNVGTKCGPQVSCRDSGSKKELATYPLVMHDCFPDYIYGHIQQELDCGKRYFILEQTGLSAQLADVEVDTWPVR